MPSIGFALIGHNEAHILPRTFESIGWADQIVYVDCESADGSVDVARKYKAQVVPRPNMRNLNVNKNVAIDHATTDWVFVLDADETIPPALAEELRRVMAANPPENGFRLARRNLFCGKWTRYGGKYPDYQTRLFRRGKGRFPAKHVHERITIDGAVGTLKEPFDHHTVDTPITAVTKLNFYTSFNAALLARAGVKPSVGMAFQYLFFKPATRFVRRFVFKGGFLDGWPGLAVATIDAIDLPLRFLKVWYWSEHPEEIPDVGGDTQPASR
jgi:glycosyltransferase involved in cell wall biosynthesis